MYQARKMRLNEFNSLDDHLKRDAAGALCAFAIEHHNGVTVTGLSWLQACELVEQNNKANEVTT